MWFARFLVTLYIMFCNFVEPYQFFWNLRSSHVILSTFALSDV